MGQAAERGKARPAAKRGQRSRETQDHAHRPVSGLRRDAGAGIAGLMDLGHQAIDSVRVSVTAGQQEPDRRVGCLADSLDPLELRRLVFEVVEHSEGAVVDRLKRLADTD